MHDPARPDREGLLIVLAELHDAVVEQYPRIAAWARHCMFRLTEDTAQFEVIADVEFEEWERSGAVDPLGSLTADELAFLLSYLGGQAADPDSLPRMVREALEGWIVELEGERAVRRGEATGR